MAVPYIETPYVHVNTAVDDVQDILDDMRTKLLAIGWTEPVANTFKTPVDAAGRFFEIIMVRTTALRLQMQLRDQLGRLSAIREMQITGTDQIALYYGAHYCWIENRTDTDEWLWASMVSQSPDSETAHPNYCAMGGCRNSAGTDDSASVSSASVYNENTSAYTTGATGINAFRQQYPRISGSVKSPNTRTATGGRRWKPCVLVGLTVSGSTARVRGRRYNTIFIADQDVTVGGEYIVPIDESTTHRFRVLKLSTSGSGNPFVAISVGVIS